MKFIRVMLRSLTSLSHLDLSFEKNLKIFDTGVINMSYGLSHLINLTSLHINLGWCNRVSDIGVSHMMDAIQNLQHLSCLHIILLDLIRVTDVSASKISDILRERTSLTDFGIDVKRTSITASGKANLQSVNGMLL
eukprot:TRINITY_DN20078_c0_g1_i1.p1 TRINITY_DN20078_c0_g1~~TRINITY_DN20078_c0_g1_i1.p1  ORF type:complete len:136 (-),score=0.49 TRINITY_DN20078_c0_g1_i1:82-489(-)